MVYHEIKKLVLYAAATVTLAAGMGANAAVIDTKTLDRPPSAVIVTGSQTPLFVSANLEVNPADSTLSPNQIFPWAYDEGTGWRQVVFQIDEINNAYPNSPPPITTDNCHYGRGPNHMEADDCIWDNNDELVFMSDEAGDRVSQDEWAPGAPTTVPRYEIVVTDPLDTSKKGWVYLYRYDVSALPTWRTDDYVTWTESNNTVDATDYYVSYADSDTNALYFDVLRVETSAGGNGTDFVNRSKITWNGGFSSDCTSNETQLRTQQTITGGGCGDYSLPWYAKDGRVRVLRYFVWSPYREFLSFCGLTNGHGFWPICHHYYYKNYWQEDDNEMFHGTTSNAHVTYWLSTVDHISTLTGTFYSSNGETFAIDGVADTPANTPLWTWYQVSSSYGSYVKVLRNQVKQVSPDSRKNLFTDNSTNRGNAGYHIENPSETTEDAWHHYYYFFLPANAANQGATYNTGVNSPLTDSATSQNYISSPPEFAGIQSATDAGGACDDLGVTVGWNAVTVWNDGCSSGCTGRRYEISRDGSLVNTVTDTAQTSWTDTTGNNNVAYDYSVEACNNLDVCTETGTTLEGTDSVHSVPTLNPAATVAADVSGCTGEGVNISWTAPQDWGDGGEGSRSYALFSSADGYASPIATPAASPYLHDAENGVAYQYRIRATNGCGDVASYDPSASVADGVGAVPSLPANSSLGASDVDCSLTGILLSWDPVASWNDNGEGSRKYDLYSSANGFTVPAAVNVSSPYLYQPGNSGAWTYRLVATNGCGMASQYADSPSVSDAQSAPAFAGVQGVVDVNGCADSALTISWNDVEGDGATGWNDGGAGPNPRIYRIYRSGTEIASSPAADGTTSVTDDPPMTDTYYVYTVRAYNMNGCWTDGGTFRGAADYAGMAPTASPRQTVAADITCDGATGVTVTWDAVDDWGDGGTNAAGRRYRLYFSRDGFTNIIRSGGEATASFTYKPVDRGAYLYRIVAVNGCGRTVLYSDSAATADLASCSPGCTSLLDNNFDPANGFAETCNGGFDLWNLAAGVGNGGSSGWLCDLGASADATSSLEMTAASNLIWTADVKLRFWSSCALGEDDAGTVEVFTNDSGLWRKIVILPYPDMSADVPSSIENNCQSGTLGGVQPAFQGSAAAAYYEARLDDYLTASTTQLKVRFRAASGPSAGASTWAIDEVKLGYGITDSVYFWSYDGNPETGVIKDGADGYGNEGIFRWEDSGIYMTSEFRIYRSETVSAGDLRQEPTAALIHQEPDTDAAFYEWTTSDGTMTVPVYFYKVYGYKEPCGESDQAD